MNSNRVIYVLAGGSGTRLKGITSLPKPLIPINAKPYIVLLLKWIALHNFANIFILIQEDHYNLFAKVIDGIAFSDNLVIPKISLIVEESKLGTAGWFLQNIDYLPDTFFACNADTIINESLLSLIKSSEKKSHSTVFCYSEHTRADAGNIQIDFNSMKITSFKEKTSISGISSSGFYCLKKNDLISVAPVVKRELNNSSFCDLEAQIFPILVKDHRLFAADRLITSILDFGVENRLLLANKFFVEKPLKWLFVDRDNTLNEDINGYTHRIEELRLIDTLTPLLKGFQDQGYFISCITNQSGIGRGFYTHDQFHSFTEQLFAQIDFLSGVEFSYLMYCPHRPSEKCLCRKPLNGLINQLLDSYSIDCDKSIVLGDSHSDGEMAIKAGLKFLHFFRN